MHEEHVAAVIYTGQEVMTYPGYIDTATGRTLTCEPGKTYEITPLSAYGSDVPTDGRFVPAGMFYVKAELEGELIPGEPEEETPEEGEER